MSPDQSWHSQLGLTDACQMSSHLDPGSERDEGFFGSLMHDFGLVVSREPEYTLHGEKLPEGLRVLDDVLQLARRRIIGPKSAAKLALV